MTPKHDYIIFGLLILGAATGIGLVVWSGVINNEILFYSGFGFVIVTVLLGFIFVIIKRCRKTDNCDQIEEIETIDPSFFGNYQTINNKNINNQPTPSAPPLY